MTKQKAVSLTFISIFVLLVILAAQSVRPVKADPAIIRVPDDYKKIQWAVGNASAGDTILVAANTYFEQVTVDKSLTLIGEDPSTTIIDGSLGGAYVIKCLNVSNVNISGFTILNGIRGIGLIYSSNANVSGNLIMNNAQYGIYVNDSSNNFVYENIVLNNGIRGVYLRFGSSNIVRNNTISGHTEYGIYVYISVNNIVSYNKVLDNREVPPRPSAYGICLRDRCTGNTISDNMVSNNTYGISIQNSAGNTLKNNNMTSNDYNFDIRASAIGQYVQDIDTSNTVNGKTMYYWVNQADKQVPAGAGYVAVINSKNITVKDQTLTNNAQGVLFAYTTNSTIVNVNASYNFVGIQIIEENLLTPPKSGNNVIKDNILANNYGFLAAGIEFRYSSDNIFTGNTVINNYYGVTSAFCNNTLYHNNFIDNINLTFIDISLSVINIWDNGYEGNYWSDYNGTDMDGDGIGDVPYVIDDRNQDNYPLMTPIILVDQIITSDDRCNVGSLQNVSIHAVWAHNISNVVEGGVYVNGTKHITNDTGWISFNATYDTIGKRVWTVDRAGGLISCYMIWDRVQVALSSSRVNVNSTASIVTAVYEYDGAEYDGIVTLNDTLIKSEVGRYGYTAQSISGDSYNITRFESDSAWVIFDAIKIVKGGVSKTRTNLNQEETVWFKAVYEYDNVAFDGTRGKLYVNGSEMAWSSENDRWEYKCSFDTAGTRIFQVSNVTDNQYALTAINDAVGAQTITWTEAVPFWMQWWFWTAIVAAGIVVFVLIYFLKLRKPVKRRRLA